ncbi:uncharacterized protein [Spinacia oleracea]|uniref:Arabidopsis retrotransposon Orf1 C-terminal domain-containing protein n=1 Tax=Spinacia oleracea TaxID=3562 RepID=A0ABM3QIX4_SPIOL|nr:uncharacterized protein LOC130459778 [Spinacia oleracea]
MMTKRSKKGPNSQANKRKAITPPAFETYGIVFPEQRSWSYYEELSKRNILPTKFYHKKTVQDLGFEMELNALIAGLDLEDFVTMNAKTYRRVTLEVLSSARINDFFTIYPNRGLIVNPVAECVDSYDENIWWGELTGEERKFISSSAKSSSFHHPVVRYLNCMLLYAVFAKGATGSLSSGELGALWLATKKDEGILDFGQLLITRIIEHRDGQPTSGDILLGGMLTLLLRALPGDPYQHTLAELDEVPGGEFLDLRTLSNAKWIKATKDDKYIWMVKQRDWCILPNPAITSWTPNVRYLLPRDPRFIAQAQRLPPPQPNPESPPHGPPHGPPRSPPILEPSPNEGGMSSSSSPFDFHCLQSTLAAILQGQANQANTLASLASQGSRTGDSYPDIYSSYYSRRVYDFHVDKGDFAPYVNYPYHPPQQGPIPSWNEERTPTYPYWTGPSQPGVTPPSFPPYDYTMMGGSDYRGDPMYPTPPPVERPDGWPEDFPGWPRGYMGGWDGPRGEPPNGNYPLRPEYGWPPYTDASGPDVDPTYNVTPFTDDAARAHRLERDDFGGFIMQRVRRMPRVLLLRVPSVSPPS